MLGHLSANQCASAFATTACNPADDFRHRFGLKLSHGNIVEKKQGLGTKRNYVIHTHGHKIFAHRIVAAKKLRNGQLGTHAIGAAHQHGIFHVFKRCRRKAGAKAAKPTDNLGASSRCNRRFDGINGTRPLVNINTCVSISYLAYRVSHIRHPVVLSAQAEFLLE